MLAMWSCQDSKGSLEKWPVCNHVSMSLGSYHSHVSRVNWYMYDSGWDTILWEQFFFLNTILRPWQLHLVDRFGQWNLSFVYLLYLLLCLGLKITALPLTKWLSKTPEHRNLVGAVVLLGYVGCFIQLVWRFECSNPKYLFNQNFFCFLYWKE